MIRQMSHKRSQEQPSCDNNNYKNKLNLQKIVCLMWRLLMWRLGNFDRRFSVFQPEITVLDFKRTKKDFLNFFKIKQKCFILTNIYITSSTLLKQNRFILTPSSFPRITFAQWSISLYKYLFRHEDSIQHRK